MNYIVETVLAKINKETDTVCIEGFSFASVGAGISFQYGLGWVIRNELHKAGISYYEVTPTQLKKFATGKGNVKKKDMIEPIKERFNYYHASNDITDAFVLSEISKLLVMGDKYSNNEELNNMRNQIISSPLNSYEIKETKLSNWRNPKSKYYFKRE